ncbi:MAG: hypothetical protein V2A73_22455, partial [Pseudomonadota bacterium]
HRRYFVQVILRRLLSPSQGLCYRVLMSTDAYRYSVERQKLCMWLEREEERLRSLGGRDLTKKLGELQEEFRHRLERVYGQVRAELEADPRCSGGGACG